jgi:hypothetical protein
VHAAASWSPEHPGDVEWVEGGVSAPSAARRALLEATRYGRDWTHVAAWIPSVGDRSALVGRVYFGNLPGMRARVLGSRAITRVLRCV